MSTVLVECADHVGNVILNRPDVLNALNSEMAAEFHVALARYAQDSAIRCIAVRGAGEGFMAGGDIGFFQRHLTGLAAGNHGALHSVFDDVHGAIRVMRGAPKPIVGGVHGAVAGFGISLMAACDLVVAADDTVFTLAYSLIGATPDGGATFALPRMIGLKRSMQLALLGERFDAQQALAMGLINQIVPAAELAAASHDLARRLAAGPTRAYAGTKRLLNASLNNDLNQQLDAERSEFLGCATTGDFAEGVNAFLAKRQPRFVGR